MTEDVYTGNFRYVKIEIHHKRLISQSKFSGPRKFTFRYQLFEIKGVGMERKIEKIVLTVFFDMRII